MAFNLFKKKSEPKPEPKKEESHGPRYFELTVREIIQETKDTITIVFDNPPAGKLSYKSGQFLTLIVPIEGREVRRAYSLCSSPFVDEYPSVTVKRVENGLMSNWLPDNLRAGDKIKVMEAMGQFILD